MLDELFAIQKSDNNIEAILKQRQKMTPDVLKHPCQDGINLPSPSKWGKSAFRKKLPLPDVRGGTLKEAFGFFLLCCDHIQLGPNPSKSFKFSLEDRICCSSGKLSYNKRDQYILFLDVTLDARLALGKNVSKVPIDAFLSKFSAPKEIQNFYSTALSAMTTAVKTTGLTSFPDILVLKVREVPENRVVRIECTHTIDISHMRSKGLQPGEELLPDDDIDAPISDVDVDPSELETMIESSTLALRGLQCAEIPTISSANAPLDDSGLDDGGGRYRLLGFVTNEGFNSTKCGYYTAYVSKDCRGVQYISDRRNSALQKHVTLYFYLRDRQ